MCRRDTNDPLLSVFAGRGYNLLRNVRTGVAPGDTWVKFAGTFEASGALSELIEGGFDVPKPASKRLLDVEKRRSDAVTSSVGLDVLGPALAAMGVPGVLEEVRTGLQAHKDVRFQIGLTNVVEKSISLAALAQDLGTSRLAQATVEALTKGRRVGIAVAVVYSHGFSIDLVDRRGSAVDLGLKVPALAGVEGKLSRATFTSSHMELSGSQPIAFGVRLYEARFDSAGRSLRIDRVHGHKVLKGDAGKDRPKPAPLVLGGLADDLFTDL